MLVFGKPILLKPRTIDHPETEVLEGEEEFIHLNRITPIYPLTEGLGQRWMRALIWRALQAFAAQVHDPWPPGARPAAAAPLPARSEAIRHTHFPEHTEQIEPARRRLALDEFVELQRQIQARRKNFEVKAQGLPCGGDNHLIKPFLQRLAFKLTPGQTGVLRQIRGDLSSPHPMRRLLQGDVGSGKTVVAAGAALMTLESGFNVALMAPTEILAEQHYSSFLNWFAPLEVSVALRTGSQKSTVDGTEKGQVSATSGKPVPGAPDGSGGRPVLTIGTHALIHSGYNPENLGLVIIDEQHRFGVIQREQLLRKGHYPHLLVMTATPIPRTLGLTLYGDLDISVIGQLPPGRGQIKTFLRAADQLPKVWDFLRGKLSEGRQAYVICPHVEENGQMGIKAVTAEFENLQRLLAPFQVGMLHGRLRPVDKEDVMAQFRARKIQILLATSIIEVGVDVANATVMLIENAEQFGLAQLHQLRGRVGRGAHDSYCILVSGVGSKAAQQRLKVLEETTDGFRIAEADLKFRGPGELLGQQQSGMPRFRFGDLVNDLALINEAREIAKSAGTHSSRTPNAARIPGPSTKAG